MKIKIFLKIRKYNAKDKKTIKYKKEQENKRDHPDLCVLT